MQAFFENKENRKSSNWHQNYLLTETVFHGYLVIFYLATKLNLKIACPFWEWNSRYKFPGLQLYVDNRTIFHSAVIQ